MGPPKEVKGRTLYHQGQPSTNAISSHDTANKAQGSSPARELRRRRATSWRLPVLESGRSEPWWYEPPGERGYPEAAEHLLHAGLTPAPNLPAMRSMWRSGGQSQRIARFITERWEAA
jgi:hypothetical protein